MVDDVTLCGAAFVHCYFTVVYVPFFQNLFKTVPLTLQDFGICVSLCSIVLFSVEIEKLLLR